MSFDTLASAEMNFLISCKVNEGGGDSFYFRWYAVRIIQSIVFQDSLAFPVDFTLELW